MDVRTFFSDCFDHVPEHVVSAPGRVEILGNHLDYNGGPVVAAAIDRRLYTAIRPRNDGVIRMASRSDDGSARRVSTTVSTYADDDVAPWSRYPLGVRDELQTVLSEDAGFDLAIVSDIPVGAGLSSSAALTTATALALSLAYELTLDHGALVSVAHRAENRFVGVPCGMLDQTVVVHAHESELVVFDGAKRRHHTLRLPGSQQLYIAQSHVGHDLADSHYETRRDECLQALLALERYIPRIRHLAGLHPVDVAVYGYALDEPLRLRARHVTEEAERVGYFLDALGRDAVDVAGVLMTASHRSSKDLFDNATPELDTLVAELVSLPAVAGARLTGAGWGGAVVAWCHEPLSDEDIASVESAYRSLYDADAHIWPTGLGGGVRRHA